MSGTLTAPRSPRRHVLAFWERRARRLLPAALLVLVSCALFTFAIAPEHLWRQYFRELVASALYAQNWALANDSVDYFAATNAPSPVQHFWTLSLEEQFYVSWPLVILGTLRLTRRAPTRFRAGSVLARACCASSAWRSQTQRGTRRSLAPLLLLGIRGALDG